MAERKKSHDHARDTERFTEAPETRGQQGRSQGNLERDVGTRDEEKRAEKGDAGVTRVTKEDEKGGRRLGAYHVTGKQK